MTCNICTNTIHADATNAKRRVRHLTTTGAVDTHAICNAMNGAKR